MDLFFIIILTYNSWALRINEIESNPEDEDAGFEWVELYSEYTVSLEGYSLDHVSRGGPINLSGSFQGFFVITFKTQWLRNSNETVFLKKDGNIVDTVGPFNDNKQDKTYSYCSSEWIFTSSTNNEENSCSGSEKELNKSQEKSSNEKEEEIIKTKQNNETKNSIVNLAEENVAQNPKKIVLNSNSEENAGEITTTYKTRVFVIYFFMALCVFLVILIAMRKL